MTRSKPDEEQDIETGGEAPATAVKRRKKKKQSATSDGEGRPSAITMDEEGALTLTQGTTTPPIITPQDTRTIATNNSGLSIDQQTILTMISTQYKNMEKDRIVREESGINQMRLPLVGMLVSSMVLLLAVLSWKGPPMWKSAVWRSYAIAYPCVTLVISLMGVLKMCNKEFYLSNGKFIHVLLFLWNFVGACFLTFLNPFTQTGNGYFAAWGTVVFAAGALGIRGIGCNNCVTIVTRDIGCNNCVTIVT